ncbi:MAG: vWA domain-containing protein [Nannocystaceae bacterium]
MPLHQRSRHPSIILSALLSTPMLLTACAKSMHDAEDTVSVTSQDSVYYEVDGTLEALPDVDAAGGVVEQRVALAPASEAVEEAESDDAPATAAPTGPSSRDFTADSPVSTRSATFGGYGRGAGGLVAKEERSGRARRGDRSRRRTKSKKRPMVATSSAARPVVAAEPPPHTPPRHSAEAYDHIAEREFSKVTDAPLSTFSIDVDTASYANMRRFLTQGHLPPKDAIRVEELVNYFSYDYSKPRGDSPFAVNAEVADCPWNDEARLVQIGLKGKEFDQGQDPRRNLVFLLDVSGSMNSPDKLPLLKKGLSMLVQNLRADDMVSIVVYAGASGVVLNPTSGEDKRTILDALNRLRAGGSTNGASGIEMAYELAQRNFDPAGINRVILATDGDSNVGNTSRGDLTRLIEQKRANGVFLSVLGFGTGNVKDSTMEMLADKGNGNYAYIDSVREAQKVLVKEAGSTLVTIAKDVKIQVEFNPAEVASYRLVGYENRALANRDFNDDKKDAGEIGAGHTVTAMYEVILADGRATKGDVDPLRYQGPRTQDEAATSGELLHLKLRYKNPQGRKSKLVSYAVRDDGDDLASASNAFRFAASVTAFGLLLRGSKFSTDSSLADVYALASGATGRDREGYRGEFLQLVRRAADLRGESIEPVTAVAR